MKTFLDRWKRSRMELHSEIPLKTMHGDVRIMNYRSVIIWQLGGEKTFSFSTENAMPSMWNTIFNPSDNVTLSLIISVHEFKG